MNEKAFRFGSDGVLSGVLTEPEKGRERPGAPAVLMWNVGMNHHVGPWRFNVELARALAANGVPSLRFDVSGLGDSDTRRDTRSDHERALADVGEAMTFLTKRRVADSFVLIGFCSSVDAAHVVGREDKRVTGVVYLEGYAFRTRGFWVRYPLRLLERERVKRFLKGSFPRVFGRELQGTGWGRGTRQAVFAREYPSVERLRDDFVRMVHDGKRLLLVYVGGDTNYNYREQFYEMYGGDELRNAVDIDYHSRMDHTFFRVDDRRVIVARVAEWVSANYTPRALLSSVATSR